jgi:hypothetical protein
MKRLKKICESERRWKERCRGALIARARADASDGRHDGSYLHPDIQYRHDRHEHDGTLTRNTSLGDALFLSNMHGEGSDRYTIDCFIARAMQGPGEIRSQIKNAVRTVGLEVGYNERLL